MTGQSPFVLLAGANGYIGRHLSRRLAAAGYRVGELVRRQPLPGQHCCDLADAAAVSRLAARLPVPSAIVHCAGDKDVNALEADWARARLANAGTVQNLLRAFGSKCPLVYFSTDYVFDGTAGPYGEADAPCPDTHYGRSKLLAERYLRRYHQHSLVLRVSGVYGCGASFPLAILRALREGQAFPCFDDAIYSPLYIDDLTRSVLLLLERRQCGLWHLSGLPVSRHHFASAMARAWGGDVRLIEPVTRLSARFPAKANLALRHERARALIGFAPTGLENSLMEMVEQTCSD